MFQPLQRGSLLLLKMELVKKDKEIKARYEMYLKGASCSQVARHYKVTRQSVWAGFKKRGYKLRSRKEAQMGKRGWKETVKLDRVKKRTESYQFPLPNSQ